MDFMPEGPSIVILREEANRFLGKTITRVEGNTTIESIPVSSISTPVRCASSEVLFRIKVHPMSKVGALPAPRLRALVAEARQYSFDFFEWKKAFVLKKHWLAHTKRTCPRCDIPFVKAHLGKTHRRSFFCERCQVRYE